MAREKKVVPKLTIQLSLNPASKKSTASKNAASAKEKTIKYADKSEGQPELVSVFNDIKAVIKKYANELKEQDGTAGMYNVLGKKQAEILGKIRDVFFAGVMVQKGFVGFYFFPIYTDPEIGKELPPELLKCLKGKSCFHIKKTDPALLEQIDEALEKGFKLYKSKGWV